MMDRAKLLERRFFAEWVEGHTEAPTLRDVIAWSNERAVKAYCDACQFHETCKQRGTCGDVNTFRFLLDS